MKFWLKITKEAKQYFIHNKDQKQVKEDKNCILSHKQKRETSTHKYVNTNKSQENQKHKRYDVWLQKIF